MPLPPTPPLDPVLRGRGSVATVAIVTWLLLLAGIGNASGVTFDEYYYLPEARDWLALGAPQQFAYHPPLAKYLLATGIRLFGDGPLGWRIASTAAGAFCVAGTFVVGRRVLRSPWSALLAALLLLTDGLFHGLARTGMLDVFSTAWFVAAALVLTRDDEGADEADRRRWVLLSSVGVGLALATKWATAPLVLVPLVLWRRGHRERSVITGEPRLGPRTLAAAGATALLVYALAWTPWLANYEHTEQARSCASEVCGTALADAGAGLVRLHATMLSSLSGQQIDHGQRAVPWTMPVGWRPVVLFQDACTEPIMDPSHCVPADASQHRIVTLVNPVAWWGFLLALPALISIGLPRRGERGDRAAVVALLGWAVVPFPFLLVDRTQFLTWMTPAVPFLALGAARALELPLRPTLRSAARALPGAAIAATVGLLLPERVPHQVALLAWAGWLTHALLVAARDAEGLGGAEGLAVTTAPARRHTAIAAVACVALFALAAPVIRGTPLPPDDARVRVIDRALVTVEAAP